ncbi:hypothetical protein CFIMG_005957RA [Ceratocystis fimbriata CBS 114723]|uniref:Nineteen complex-related protein 2-domain-containing protein n=1 Tax=Ceratocystis fimbriata CBS 114723 TaxID=1035309 RepID=A0A2C5X084_9PEZI|nr:hypothetical protein CFIMG_005957RA [Ceratocystis fimbriata CBS 114723]
MSSFGFKRKARIIKTDHANEDEESSEQNESEQPVFKPVRKPNRQTSLRRDTTETIGSSKTPIDSTNSNTPEPINEDEHDGPTIVRPVAARQNSLKPKRRPKNSRLSFGGAADENDANESDGPVVVTTAKKNTLSARAQENSALRRNAILKGLPVRSMDADEDRPIYSKEYLEELQNSTPVTPQNISLQGSSLGGDEMELDSTELEGAVIVTTSDLQPEPEATRILTETEIRERKERRARLAREGDGDGVDEDDVIQLDQDSDGNDGSMLSVLRRRKKENNTRLVREDEDLGEGFDDFVEDGGIALGRKAEREAQKRRKREIAEIINTAEGNSSDDLSDEEAKRRIAFEAAQSRAGMEGLEKPTRKAADRDKMLQQVPPRLAPIPTLAACTASIKERLVTMQRELALKSQQVADLRQEKQKILARETEVQALLDEAGMKYQAALGKIPKSKDDAGQSSADVIEGVPGSGKQITTGHALNQFAMERGLESMGSGAQNQNEEGYVSSA